MYTIIIGQRGWVWVGYEERTSTEVVIAKGACIREWGTTRGLGELENGPLTGTVLEKVSRIRLHPLQVIARYDVDQEAWEKALNKLHAKK